MPHDPEALFAKRWLRRYLTTGHLTKRPARMDFEKVIKALETNAAQRREREAKISLLMKIYPPKK